MAAIGLLEIDLTSNFSAKLGFFDVVANFAYHIQLLQGFFNTRMHYFQMCFNWKIFCYGSIYVKWHKEVDLTSNFSVKLKFFDVFIFLLIIFVFPKVFYTRIHHFQKCFN